MPQESASVPTEPKKESVTLDTAAKAPPKLITFHKTKFLIFLSLGILLLILVSAGSYFLGQDAAKKEVVATKEDTSNKETKENIPDLVAYYSPSSFRLKDSKNNQYTSGYGYEGGAPQTNNYSLNPSEVTKMTVSYIVPTSEKNFTLIYENVVIDFSI